MRQCARDERWAGLWDFPRFPVEAEGSLFAHEEIVTKVQLQTGISCVPSGLVTTIRHGVTRYRIALYCYHAVYVGGRVRVSAGAPVRWTTARELAELPLSSTGRKIAQLLCPDGQNGRNDREHHEPQTKARSTGRTTSSR
jgi:A/G-specific adenine glycosylase